MKKKAIAALSLCLVLALGGFLGYWACKYYCGVNIPEFPDHSTYENLEERAGAALVVAHRNGLNEKYCVFVDYSIPSGTPRMFVWSFEENKVIASTYVMHGSGRGSTAEKAVFSNKPGSDCSALGRFAITRQHGSRNKGGYYVRGLDFDNQTARSRGIMVHSAIWVDLNCWRKYIPLNERSCRGCFTTSSRGMAYLRNLIESEGKNIMIWAYC